MLHSHVDMIDLNPLVIERHPIKAPSFASPEEFHCQWYSLTDRVQYLPGGLMQGKVTYSACFHDLTTGLQTHVFAPMGLDIKNKWTLGGNLPGEPREAVELGLGVPKVGLWLREDVDMRCNMLMTGFVKKTLKKAHATLVARLVEKSHISEVESEQRSDYLSVVNQYAQYPGGIGSMHGSLYGRGGGGSAPPSVCSDSLSHSPSLSSKSHNTPYSSPSYQNMDPGYQSARQSYQSMASMSVAPSPRIDGTFTEKQPSFAVELPATPAGSQVTELSGPIHVSELPSEPASGGYHPYVGYQR